MDDSQDQSVTDYLSDWANKGMGVVKNAFTQPGLAQKVIGATGIPGLSDLANAKSLTDSIQMPKPVAPVDPMAKPFDQEDEQSAAYKPPFGNEPPPAPIIDKSAAPDTAVDDGSDDETRKSNPKVASSHPGFDQDALEKYIQSEKDGIDKYGAGSMADQTKKMVDDHNSLRSSVARGGATFADALMQGVAGKGNPGFAQHLAENEQRMNELKQHAMDSENSANMAAIKAKQGLDTQSSQNPLGASSASAMMPMLKQLYPGKTDAEYAAMAHNPAVAEGLLPEEVKMKDAQARLAEAAAQRQFQHQMMSDKFDYAKGKDVMTREQKDQGAMMKDPNVVKAQGTLDKLGTARQLLEAGNVNNASAKQALQTALTFVATGGQRVNETEMKQLGGAHTVSNRVGQWMQGLNAGTLTPRDYQDMKQVIGIYENGAHASLADATKRYSGIQANREGISPDQATKNLTGNSPAPAAQVAPDVAAYAAKHGITPEQAQEIKNKRMGAQ